MSAFNSIRSVIAMWLMDWARRVAPKSESDVYLVAQDYTISNVLAEEWEARFRASTTPHTPSPE